MPELDTDQTEVAQRGPSMMEIYNLPNDRFGEPLPILEASSTEKNTSYFLAPTIIGGSPEKTFTAANTTHIGDIIMVSADGVDYFARVVDPSDKANHPKMGIYVEIDPKIASELPKSNIIPIRLVKENAIDSSAIKLEDRV